MLIPTDCESSQPWLEQLILSRQKSVHRCMTGQYKQQYTECSVISRTAFSAPFTLPRLSKHHWKGGIKNIRALVWRDDSDVKSTYCSFRGSDCSFQQTSGTLGQKDFICFSALSGHLHSCVYMLHTERHSHICVHN